VEYFGPGLESMPLADRATISNMSPEYGATVGFFPVDKESLDYLRLTGRSEEQIALVEKYCKENDLSYSSDMEDPEYTEVVEINLFQMDPNLAGRKLQQGLMPLAGMKNEFNNAITAPVGNQGFGLEKSEFDKEVTIAHPNGKQSVMKTGSLAIAAITS